MTPGTVKRVIVPLVAIALVAGPIGIPARASDGAAVTRWIDQALQAVRARNVGTPDAGRLYAMVSVAVYDAVNGIDTAKGRGRAPALVPPDGAPTNGDQSVAAAAAAHAVLSALTPAQRPVLDQALDAELGDGGRRNAPPVTGALQWGRSVGEQVVSLRSTDGTQSPEAMPAGSGPGVHRAQFDARFRHMLPFGVADKSRYTSGPPPALSSAEYAAAFDDVRTFGRADGDAERDQISNFWLAEGGTVRETGTWIQAGVAIATQRGTVKSVSDSARLFALLGMAIADAVSVSWETKAQYFAWRPTVAIREAGTDDNPATTPDPTWTSRIGSVGGSPEYNSGTSAFAGAASAVLEHFYTDEELDFCFQTDKAIAGPRCYDSALAGALEAGRSRIYQGIHFQYSNDDGRRVGRFIGQDVATNKLGPLDAAVAVAAHCGT